MPRLPPYNPAIGSEARASTNGCILPTEKHEGTVLEKGDPRLYREEVIALFERHGNRRFRERFDCYYSNNGQDRPTSWLLRSRGSGRLLGLCTVVPRKFRCGSAVLKGGVLGNLLVDRESRKTLGALNLVYAAKSLVIRKEIDVLLGITNSQSRQLALRLGFHFLGFWDIHVRVFRPSDLLRSSFSRLASLLKPFLDWPARHIVSEWSTTRIKDFPIMELRQNELSDIPIETWASSDGSLVAERSIAYLRWRFLKNPFRQCRVLGLVDPRSEKVCGHLVVTSGSGVVRIWDCCTDSRRLSEAQAILNLCREWRQGSVFCTATLRSSTLSEELQHVGFVRFPYFSGGVVGLWRPDHPLAGQFNKASAWNLFLGFKDV